MENLKKTELYKTWQELPPWAKGVVAIAGTGVAIFAGVKIYGALKGLNKDKGNRSESSGWNKELDKLNSNPATRSTLSKLQADTIANQMFGAMDGLGTDEETLYRSARQIKNDADWAAVNAAYGIREVSSGLFWEKPFRGTLSGALSNELSDDKLNPTYFLIPGFGPFLALYGITSADTEISTFNKILKKNGTKYQL